MKHQGKNAIVTGAGSGIGYGISKMLVSMGYVVYGIGRTESKLADASNNLGELFVPIILDVSNSEAVEQWFAAFNEPVDVLVNNAGLAIFGGVDEQKVDDWNTMISINLSGVFYMTRLATANMKKHKLNGYVINISSVAGLIGNPNLSGYNATKFGLRGFSEAIMKELRPYGIRVSCIFPGSVATPFFTDKGIETHDNMLQPEDIAESVHFLLNLPQRALVDELVMRPTSPR